MSAFVILCLYLIGIGVTFGILVKRGYDGGIFDLDYPPHVLYAMILSILWPAVVVMETVKWLVLTGIGR